MIKSIKITNLYYIYSYDINLVNDANLLILTGPNGFGKTTILQIINHLCSLRLWYFNLLPFDRIEIRFVGDIVISMEKLTKDKHGYGDVKFVMTNGGAEATAEDYTLKMEDVERMTWRHHPIGNITESARLDEFFETYHDDGMNDYFETQFPNISSFLHTHGCAIIEEQRLVVKKSRRSSSEYSRTVEEIQAKISTFYAEAQKAYNSASLKIDGSFVKRLSDIEPTNKVKHIKREKIYSQVLQKIADYKKYDLVGELEVVANLGVHYNEVLKLYLTDLYQKLYSIDKYYNKLSTFDRLVSGKHLAYKELKFKNDKMYIEGVNGNEIPVRKLSSGEQNLLVLCHNLIFGLDDKNVLLIDEPENSMHMAWLQNMLDDYISIAKTTGCQIIIATHSPAFIHGKWNLTYDLCENGAIQEFKGDGRGE